MNNDLCGIRNNLHADDDAVHVAEEILCSVLKGGLVEVKFELHSS